MTRFSVLRDKIKSTCVKHGDFTLKSGEKSNIYFDLRILTLSTDVWYLAQALSITLENTHYDAIGGPESGANQIVGAFQAAVGSKLPWPKRGFVVRKAEKGYGSGELIVGSLRKGDRAVMVEDVTTSGLSVLRAVEAVEREGATVEEIVSVVDREKGATELFQNKCIPFRSLFKMGDLL